jgi:CRISPR-associated protein Csm1
MYQLGGKLLRVKAIVRSQREKIPSSVGKLSFLNCYYHLFDRSEINNVSDSETVFLINDWTINHYRQNNTINLLLGNYGRQSQITEETGFMRTSEMAERARGINRVGYLRMDVDRLGQIFARGLDKKQTLPRIAGLSRLMSYFFKVYLNSLAKSRQTNFLKKRQTVEVLKKTKYLSENERLNLLFIYAGGDDLFVCGSWNEVVEFGFDVYQCFRAYTGHHPNVTLSGGISLVGAKFPLYQAAAESGKAEDAAKDNGRNSLGLFGQVFKWDEWLGTADLEVIDREIQEYLRPETKPELFGIFPFVEWLENQKIEVNYSRNFVRNLLATAQVQEQMSKEIKENRKEEEYKNHQKDIRYFLHLPKIAYTLARLPKCVLTHESFEPVRISLKSPYNAPYFRAIATWIELLNRSSTQD